MRGMSILAPDAHEVDRSTEATFSSGRLDSEDIEVLREDLVRMVYEHTRAGVEYLFGDSITALGEEETGVRVDFAHGSSRTFDLVVGADGLHSTVRRLAFGPEGHFAHHLGSYLSVFSADNFLALDDWQMWLRDGDTGFGIMPVRGNTQLRIAFGFESAPLAHDLRDGGALRQLVVDKLASMQWEGTRLAEAARKAPDFYCDAMAQIRMDQWSRGRVALLGDAGYCPSPLSQGRAPAWPSSAPTCWPTALPKATATTAPRMPATSGGCAPSSPSTRHWPPRIPAGPPRRNPSHTPNTHSHWTADPLPRTDFKAGRQHRTSPALSACCRQGPAGW